MKNKNQLQQKVVEFIKNADLYMDNFEYVDMDKIKNTFSKFKEMKKIIIVVTHEKEVMQFCDSTISMEDL